MDDYIAGHVRELEVVILSMIPNKALAHPPTLG